MELELNPTIVPPSLGGQRISYNGGYLVAHLFL